MKKHNNSLIVSLFSKRYISYPLFIVSGIFIGWLLFHDGRKNESVSVGQEDVIGNTIWTCAMHPQIRMPQAGDCPICGMDLIPLAQSVKSAEDPGAVHFTKEAAALANVLTTTVSKQIAVKEIRMYGKVQADERMLQSQVSHISGRIEKLYVNYTGETIKKGQVLAQIYSPELITAQQELIESAKIKVTQPAIYEAAREKLRQWKITEEQIIAIEKSGVTQPLVEVVSNSKGIIMSKLVNTGSYVSQGTTLFEVVDISKLWVLFDAYESDLPFLETGDKISFTLEALPGEKYSGTIVFIDPVIDPVTRVAKVRVEADNRSGKLKPEMFVSGIVSTTLKEFSSNIIIPQSAVLWTGKRSVVYVKLPDNDEPVFRIREIELGPSLGDTYVVESGLNEGEEIVTNGTFSVDAAAQLAGKPSMMNQAGGLSSSGHDHGKMSENADNSISILSHAEFRVEGNCEMCKDRIETTAKEVTGVESADWNIETKSLHISYNQSPTHIDDVKKALAAVGHDNDKFKAPDEVYNKLPECCLYRK